MHAGRSSCVHLVSRTPSLILHLQAELKSGAETQRRSSPDWCTSSSWATCRPCRVSRVKTLSEIWKGPEKNTDQANAPLTTHRTSRLLPARRWRCCPHLITDSSGNVANLHPTRLSDVNAPPVEVLDADIHPWSQSKAEIHTCGLIGKCCVMQLLASWNHDTQYLHMSRNYILWVFKYLQSSRVVADGSDSADLRWTPARLADCWTSRRQSWSRLPGSETSGQSPGTRDQREEKRRQNRSVHRSD